MEKANWEQKVKEIITGYLSRGDGCFDAEMHAKLCGYSYEEQMISIEFETLKWQINERGGIHGGAIAGMFEYGLWGCGQLCSRRKRSCDSRYERVVHQTGRIRRASGDNSIYS